MNDNSYQRSTIMYEKCIGAVKQYLPKIHAKDRMDLLWGATCFPFGDSDQTKKQIRELAKKTQGTLGACLAFADKQLTRSMREYNAGLPATGGGTLHGEEIG